MDHADEDVTDIFEPTMATMAKQNKLECELALTGFAIKIHGPATLSCWTCPVCPI